MPGLHSSLTPDLLFPQVPAVFPAAARAERPLHRINEVRRTQHLSLASIAKRLEQEVPDVRLEEQPQSDILLSKLYRWAAVLEVPVEELLVEPGEQPTNPIRNRGLLLRMMKTVRSILEGTEESRTRLLAQTLNDQLVELMPELAEITPWPVVGHARENREPGAAVLRRFDPNIAAALED